MPDPTTAEAPAHDPTADANAALPADVLEQALHSTDIMVVLTDPRQEDNPIVWVNDHFCAFTGYGRDEVLGRNCRFLQGPDRDQPGRHRLRRAIDAGEKAHVLLRNYKKDGTPFDNDLFVSPVLEDPSDPESPVVYFVGVQNDETARVAAEAEVGEREREIHETAENERERFGMDLHDGLGQEVVGLALLARSLHGRLEERGDPEAAAAGRLAELLDGALSSVRDMARGLNPVDASRHGLGDALRTLCARADEAAPGLSVRANVEPVAFEDRRSARHLYRLAQEAVSNAVKHAGATAVVVTLHRAPGPDGPSVFLEVADDGRGIDPAVLRDQRAADTAVGRARLARRGMGVYGMRYRAELVGASLTVERRDGWGTVVRCVLPEEGGGRSGQRSRRGERE